MGWSTSAPLLVFLAAPAAAFLPSPPLRSCQTCSTGNILLIPSSDRSSFPLRGDCGTFSSAVAACGAPASFWTRRPVLPASRSRRDRRSGQTLRCQVQQQEERQQKPPISFSESGQIQFFGVEATAEVSSKEEKRQAEEAEGVEQERMREKKKEREEKDEDKDQKEGKKDGGRRR